MFGFRDKDKEQLEENMEEIKQLINKGKGSESEEGDFPSQEELREDLESFENDSESFDQPENQNQDGFDKTFEDDFAEDTDSEEPEETRTQTTSFDEQPHDQNQPQPTEDENFDNQTAKNEQQPQTQQRHEGQGFNDQPSQSQQRRRSDTDPRQRSASSGERGRSGKTEQLNNQVPEPPKTRKIDVPEIDKGPLFIRRKKFENAQELIHEMRYISQEIEQVMNRLEKGIKEDHDTEREAKELLSTLDDDRDTVRKIISPGNDNKQQ